MNTSFFSQFLATFAPETVLYALAVPGSVLVYAVRDGVLYEYRATDTGHGYMIPQAGGQAAWARVAMACAFTVPANPQTMRLGAAGERLGAFWRDLPDTAAECRLTVPDLLAAATA